MKGHVSDRLDAFRSTVRNIVDDRIRTISQKLDGNVMSSTKTISSKIDDIAREASGRCFYDDRNTVSVYLSEKNLQFINELRRKNPIVFERVAEFAKRFAESDADSKVKNEAAVNFFNTLLQFPGSYARSGGLHHGHQNFAI